MAIKQEIDLSIDRAAAQRVEAALDSINAQSRELKREFDRGNLSLDQFANKLGVAEAEARRLNTTLNTLSQPRTIDVRSERFDAVSRDVGLAGDVQSNLGAVGGLAGAAGLPGAGGVGVAGELVALVEELPRLKAAVQGMPATIQAAGMALGGTGAGLVGALGIAAVAIGAVAIAARVAADQIKQAAQDFSQVIDARVQVEKLIAAGDTTTAQAQELAQARAAEAEAVRKVQAELEAAQAGLTGFQKLLNQIVNLLPGIDGINDKIRQLDDEADGLEAEVGQLNQAIESGRFAAGDRAAAETASADASAALEKALASSTQTADVRAESEAKLAAAMSESATVANEAGAAFDRFARDAQGRSTRSFGFRAIGGGGGGGGGGRAATAQAAQPRRDEAADIQRQIADAERKAGQARVDAAIQYNRDIEKIATDNARRLEDIRRQAARQEQDAARNRDFAGVISAREQSAQQIADANLEADRAAADRRTALDAQLADQTRANQRQLAQLRSKVQAEGQILQQGYNQALGATRGFVRSLRREFEQGQRGDISREVQRQLGRVARGS